jgi:hypothetical protein
MEEKEILELIRLVDKKYKKGVWDIVWNSSFFIMVLILILYIPVAVYVGSIKDIGEQLKITIPFFALIVAFFALVDREIDKGSIQGNYKKLSKDKTVNKSNSHLLKSLIKMKSKQKDISLEQIYNEHPEMFTKEKLLEKLYE